MIETLEEIFAFLFFQVESCCVVQAGLKLLGSSDPAASASQGAETRGVNYHIQLRTNCLRQLNPLSQLSFFNLNEMFVIIISNIMYFLCYIYHIFHFIYFKYISTYKYVCTYYTYITISVS